MLPPIRHPLPPLPTRPRPPNRPTPPRPPPPRHPPPPPPPRPAFAATAILTLALGIGANTAIFSVVYTVLLRPLPWPAADRIVALSEQSPTQHIARTGYQTFLDWRSNSHVLSAAAAMYGWYPALSGQGGPFYVSGLPVSSEFFDVFGATMLRGRGFLPQDDRRGAGQVVVIAESLWRRALSADPHAIGRTILLDSKPYEIVGVQIGRAHV